MDLKNDISSNLCTDRDKDIEFQYEPLDLDNYQELKFDDNSLEFDLDREYKQSFTSKKAPSTAAETEIISVDNTEESLSTKKQLSQHEEYKINNQEEHSSQKKRGRNSQEITDDDLNQILSKEEIQLLNQQRPIQDLEYGNSNVPLLNKKLKVQKTEQSQPSSVNIPQIQQNQQKNRLSGKITEDLVRRFKNLEKLVTPLVQLKNRQPNISLLNSLKAKNPTNPLIHQNENQKNQFSNRQQCDCQNCKIKKMQMLKLQSNANQQNQSINTKERRQQVIQKLYQRMSSIEKLILETKTEIVKIKANKSSKETNGLHQVPLQAKQQAQIQKNQYPQFKKQMLNSNSSTQESGPGYDAHKYFI